MLWNTQVISHPLNNFVRTQAGMGPSKQHLTPHTASPMKASREGALHTACAKALVGTWNWEGKECPMQLLQKLRQGRSTPCNILRNEGGALCVAPEKAQAGKECPTQHPWNTSRKGVFCAASGGAPVEKKHSKAFREPWVEK